MARETIVQLTDDLTGEPADETVKFGLDGREYEIDLSEKNATELREVLAPYVSAGVVQRASMNTGRRPTPAAASYEKPNRRSDVPQIREWARARGIPMSDRGRVPADIIAQYDASN